MVRPVYDPDNRLGAWNSASGRCVTPAITWDQDGNLVNDGTHAYSWNARNRLSSITGYGTSYIYDALGRRLSTTKGGTTTFNVYDVANPLQEARSGAVIANLFNGLGTDERFSRTVVSTGGTASHLTDTLGSTVALANGSGTVVTNDAYDPYGVTTSSGTANTSIYHYTGRENDSTGLYYVRARYYNPAWGRFISEDPIGFGGGINKYAYVWGNPINNIDPFGLWGFGLIGSGSAEGGVGVAGAGVSGSVGGGVFGNGFGGVNVGGFVGGGAFAGGPNYGGGYPGPQSGGTTAAVGGYGGIGAGAFFTNATSAQGLSGPFNTYSYNLVIGPIGFSFQLGVSGGAFLFSGTFGPGSGYSVTTYPTTTCATGPKKCGG